MCSMNRYGFPRASAKTVKRYTTCTGQNFQSGDVVRLKQPSGKYKGIHIGTLSVRATGQFDITTRKNQITSNVKNFIKVCSFNGYHIKHKGIHDG